MVLSSTAGNASDAARFISDRAKRVKESGIRRIFHLAATLENPVDFSIGQPNFDVPDEVKAAAIRAITDGHNGYTVTAGLPALRHKIAESLTNLYDEPPAILVCSGVSGGLLLALMATINRGDEILVPDPYFVSYPALIEWLDGTPVYVSGYPNFGLDPDALRAAITPQTKVMLINSPNNPTGIVYSRASIEAACDIAREHDLLIISDEIYSDLSYDGPVPSAARHAPERTLLLRGFGKSYGMTGWRMGYLAGPEALINQIANMQQYTFVCAPSIAQHACVTALDTDLSERAGHYRRKRDTIAAALDGHYVFSHPSGGFYFFLETPKAYASGTAFVEAALERNLLTVPGSVFSTQDTHIRISYAVDDDVIDRGCEILRSMA